MLTEEQIAESRQERARLQAVADRLGLKCDVAELRNPLRVIADALDAQGGVSSTRAAVPSLTTQRAATAPHATLDVGDRAVELMAARRAGREPAAWASQPPKAGGK